VVEAAFASRTDVHSWALADRVETLEDGDRAGVVLLLCHSPPPKGPKSVIAKPRLNWEVTTSNPSG
jgi:hypothetical protein